MNRPKFCVGEVVRVACFNQPDIAKTEVIEVKYATDIIWRETLEGYTGFMYKVVDVIDPSAYSEERDLHKLPPEERASWEDSEWKPSDIREPVLLEL